MLDLNSIDFADPKLGHLDVSFGDSFPVSDVPYNTSSESGVQYNAFPQSGAQYDREEIGRLFNEFVHPVAMA